MINLNDRPIGIFDSGIGGLTVAKTCIDHLPHENIIYFGDTAHLPYGDKSASTIQTYALNIAKILLDEQCKLILIACNSASAAAYKILQETFGHQVPIVNVIDPTIDFISQHYKNCHIGLIGTKQTVNSNIYAHKIQNQTKNITLHALATPLLVPAIEDGFHDHKIIDELLKEYLSYPIFKNIEALILGCTHYPIIKKAISHFYQDKMDIIDSSNIVAASVEKNLIEKDLLNKTGGGLKHCYVSDLTDAFAMNAKLFLGKDVMLEHYVSDRSNNL